VANPSKQKGTGGETELLRLLAERGILVKRREAGAIRDLRREGWEPGVRALATRPDRGQWLFTMDLPTFCEFIHMCDVEAEEVSAMVSALDIEVKRYARFSLHSIFEKKFPRSR
jgi:hypothetical protein